MFFSKTLHSHQTVCELCAQYVKLKSPLMRHNTVANYKTSLKIISEHPFGHLKVREVTKTKAKLFLSALQNEDGRSFPMIRNLRGVLRPAFEQAVDDGIINSNPFDFELKSVLRNDIGRRDALTAEELSAFLSYVRDHKQFYKYYDLFYLQFHTGLRVSELCGLTESDIHFDEHYISVERQLQRKRTMELYLTLPKTRAGIRKVPITPDVEICLHQILANRPINSDTFAVSGDNRSIPDTHGFLFFDRNGTPFVAQTVENHYRTVSASFNRYLRLRINSNTNETSLKPITSHVARHTFCSLRVKEGMQPVTLQCIMGHSSIRTTLGWYTHLTDTDVINEALSVMNKDSNYAKYNIPQQVTGE